MMLLLLNVSSYDERWAKALEAAKKYDYVVIDSKNLIFVVVDKLAKLIEEECTECEHVEVNISDISFTNIFCILFHCIYLFSWS